MEINEEIVVSFMKQIVTALKSVTDTQNEIADKFCKADTSQFITITEARKRLAGIAERTFRQMLDEGVIESIYVGAGLKKRVVVTESLEKYVRKVRKDKQGPGDFHASATNWKADIRTAAPPKKKREITDDEFDMIFERNKYRKIKQNKI